MQGGLGRGGRPGVGSGQGWTAGVGVDTGSGPGQGVDTGGHGSFAPVPKPDARDVGHWVSGVLHAYEHRKRNLAQELAGVHRGAHFS